jgi:hypothetical protein
MEWQNTKFQSKLAHNLSFHIGNSKFVTLSPLQAEPMNQLLKSSIISENWLHLKNEGLMKLFISMRTEDTSRKYESHEN